jgi:hypothetical protein
VWPELAEYDCFACHQRLRPIKAPISGRGDRTAGLPGASSVPLRTNSPGIPGWQAWNLALAEPLAGGEQLAALRQSLGQSLFADPEKTKRLAEGARRELHAHPLSQALRGSSGGAFSASELTALVEHRAGPEQSWAESGQQLLALQAAYLAWRDRVRVLRPSVQLVSSSARTRLPLALDVPDEQILSRLSKLASAVKFGSPEFEWPAYDWQGRSPLDSPPALTTSAAVAEELAALAEDLHGRLAAEN